MQRSTVDILRGSSVYLVSTVLNSLAAFVVAILVSSTFGKEGLGIFSVCLTLLLVGGLLSDLGLNTFIIRAFAAEEVSSPLGLRSLLMVRIAASGVVSILLAAAEVVFLRVPQIAPLVAASVLIVNARSVSGALESAIKARRQAALLLSITALSSILLVVVVALVLRAGGGIAEALLALAGVEIAKSLMLLTVTLDELQKPAVTAGNGLVRLKAVLHQSSPFAVMAFLSLLGDRVDIVLLAALGGPGQAGVYAAADRFLMAGIFVGYAFLASAFPILSSAATSAERERIARQTFLPFGLTALAGSALLWIAAPLLIRWTFHFEESILLLRILLFALPAMVINNVIRVSLFSFGKERAVVMMFGIASIGNLALNIVLIPRFGAVGAAVIAVATEYGITVMYGILYGRTALHTRVKSSENVADIA